ncbi:MAG: hypothetical protein IJL69_06225 [Oscillospiraceae bacterium]|nr:hypothetical protein [Oscillospiraceae bacterium]
MTLQEKIVRINGERNKSYWSGRIAAELEYLARLSAAEDGKFDRDVGLAADSLLGSLDSDGVITDAAARFAEKLMSQYSAECRRLTVICAGHAHIDMNWMWGFQETAALTVDTFRTVLDLMDEYPDFTFSQSQASVYRIVEQYAPWMLEEIRERIREGRWEVTASTWVEADKNMSSGEALVTHIRKTKSYLSELLGIDPDGLDLDFEPDTFGHSANVPEICAAGGVKYYYHCRGFADECLYRWRSPSGAELLCYRDGPWYNAEVGADFALMAPEFCRRYGTDCMIRLYGVGDHGGGPTRRDVERLTDMAAWPVMATVKFGTIGEFFRRVEPVREGLPLCGGEKNFIFTGCYTSQSRIKMANALGERRLTEAGALAAMADAFCGEKLGETLDAAWEKVLFNQFHDILPGSGKIDTREYAMGGFQQALAAANIISARAMADVAGEVDVSLLPEDLSGGTVSEGAGVGFALDQPSGFALPRTERGRGRNRAFVLFNPSAAASAGPAELTVWDWPEDAGPMRLLDAEGRERRMQILEQGKGFWGHRYTRLLADTAIPPMGWAACWITEGPQRIVPFDECGWFDRGDRVDEYGDGPVVLSNGKLTAVFDRRTMKLVSLRTGSGAELIGASGCRFELVTEDTVRGMTAWRVGCRSRVTDLNEAGPVRVTRVSRGALREEAEYEIAFSSSTLRARVWLDAGEEMLRAAVTVDWHERGDGRQVPSLVFTAPLGYESRSALCAVPMGVVRRAAADHDVPCLGILAPENAADPSAEIAALAAEGKYGFRFDGTGASVSLIRSSTEPDPCPEQGLSDVRLALCVCRRRGDAMLAANEAFLRRTAVQSVRPHKGTLPAKGSFVRVEGAALSAVKPAADGNEIVVRVFNPLSEAAGAKISLCREPAGAFRTDACERDGEALARTGGTVSLELPPQGTAAVRFTKA